MNPTAFDHIQDLISRANDQIALLDTLLNTDRPQFVQRIVYLGVKFYLQVLIAELEQIAWELALQEIRAFVGNEIFTGKDTNNELYPLEMMAAIRDALVNDCTPADLECIVGKTATFPQINAAVKQRIIDDVIEIVGFAYTGRDSSGNALPVPVNGNEIPWDDDTVPASALFAGVPFTYNRQAAADKAEAMANGTDNSLDLFADSGTDSARFISLALHAGGFPMTVKPGESDCDTSSVALPLPSWCAKEVIPDIFEGNKVWLVHNSATDNAQNPISNLEEDERLVGYLLGNPDVLGAGIVYKNGGFYEVVSVEEVIGTPSELLGEPSSIESFANDQILPTTSPPIYDVYGNSEFDVRVQQVMARLTEFDIGDYIFTGLPHFM